MNSLRRLLQPSGFRDLVIGQFVSAFGDWMATIALMALVYEVTGSPEAVGGILAIRLMPSLLAGPVATWVALNLDRRRTMLVMDLVRIPLVLLIPLSEQLWWIYGLAFLTELGNLVFLPARDAAVPDLVDRDDLPTANGLVLVSSYANIPLGAGAYAAVTSLPDVFGGVLSDHPFVIVFALDALTYLVSFLYIRRIELEGEGTEEAVEGEAEVSLTTFFEAFKDPLLRAVLPGLLTVMLGIGALFSLGLVYVREVLVAGDVAFGILIAFFGVGAAASVGWVQGRDAGATIHVVRGGVAAMGLMLAVMSLVSDLLLSYGVAIFFGAAAATALVGALTFLQEQLQGRRRILAFTAFHVLFRFGLSISAIGAGFAVDRVPTVDWPLVGQVAPASLILFAAGILVLLGAIPIRAEAVESATAAHPEPTTDPEPQPDPHPTNPEERSA